MQTNLVWTANFMDVTRPALIITNLTSGQRISNPVFTVSGKAGDNSQVGSVWLKLNGGNWFTATGTTNWTAVLNPSPGTNVVSAYAVDTSGNASLTNRVSFDFVVTNQLSVQTIGLGTVSPNYSNAWLEVEQELQPDRQAGDGFCAHQLDGWN